VDHAPDPNASSSAQPLGALNDRSTALGAAFGGLCLAGCTRSKHWLVGFLKELGWMGPRGLPFALGEVETALNRLCADRKIAVVQGMGFCAGLIPREEWLIENFDADLMGRAWKAWVRAQTPHAAGRTLTPAPSLRDRDERVALGRLLVYSNLDRHQFEAQRYHLGFDDDQPLVIGLLDPFLPSAFARVDPKLRRVLLERWTAKFETSLPIWESLLDWLDARIDRTGQTPTPEDIPDSARLAVARRRAYCGQSKAALVAVQGMDNPRVGEILAVVAAVEGRWDEAVEGFQTARKLLARDLGARQGLLSFESMRWMLLSLLARQGPSDLQTARKLCIAESGSRKPRPEGWGLWAYAIGCRLGEERPLERVFAGPASRRGSESADDADRLLLAAWLGLTLEPESWPEDDYVLVIDELDSLNRHCRADLVRDAVVRLGLPPAPPLDTRKHCAPPFFGAPREPWREALEAMTRLAPAPTRRSAIDTPATLVWLIDTDDIGRVTDITPHERSAGARGRSRIKEITLAKVARSTSLDPRDAAVARSIESMRRGRSSYGIDVATAAVALIGHPGCMLGEAPDEPVELRESLPELEVRRTRNEDGSEAFEFHPLDPIRETDLPYLGDRWTASNPETEITRRNSIRVLPGVDGEARLIRITPTHRQVAELISRKWRVPVDAKAELDAALRALSGHFQLHSDAEAGNAVASESRLRAQFTPRGDALQLRLVVRPFGEFGPTLTPGSGRERTLTVHEGLELSTRRDLRAERAHLNKVMSALPFLADDDADDALWMLDDPELALQAVERLSSLECIAGLDWPRGKSVRVTSLNPAAIKVAVSGSTDWFEIEGEVKVDETRVLGLQKLIAMIRDNHSTRRFVALGEGDYLALTDRLRAQLSDLAAIATPHGEALRLPSAAAAFTDAAISGFEQQVSAEWLRGVQRLDEAAALAVSIPTGLQAELRDYQREGVIWMSRMAHAGLGAILADDMGLGKTVQTLALLLGRAATGPALVVAPTSVCGNWVAEAQRFAPSLRVVAFGEGDRAAMLEALGPGDVIVASYALAMIESTAFAEVHWSTLVLDEAQMLKNAATQRGRAIASLKADFRLALTGTPVENRLSDLWSIMNLLNPGLLGRPSEFNERFAIPIERQRDEPARARLRRLISPFLLRRTKAQVLADLPERTETVLRVEPGQREREFLEAMRRAAIDRVAGFDEEDPQQSFHVLAELTRLRRAACDPRLVAPELGLIGEKVQEFERLARELSAGRHKALVFSQFTDFLELLGERLTQAGIAFQTLTGSTPAAERNRRVAAFQAGEGDLFLISLKAGGFGLNLTAADYVIIVDPWWNPAAEDQASGRAHRIGQQRPVTVYRLVTTGSIEEQIIDLHRRKRDLADGVLEGQDSGTVVSADELRALLAGK
jgi:superfamily II DNA or RNA helicase